MVILTDTSPAQLRRSTTAPPPLAPSEDADTLVALGLKLEAGLAGQPRDLPRAISLYRRACAAGSARGAYCLGVCYFNGAGVPQNRAEARRLYRAAVAAGSSRAAVTLGDLLEDEGDGGGALRLYVAAAAAGLAEGMLRAGLLLGGVAGVERNPERAFSLYLLAEERAESEVVRACAQRCVGIAYMEGDGVAMDWARAIEWLRLAVENRDEPVARYLLGVMYRKGDGRAVAAQSVEALRCFETAAQEGHGGAACSAANMLETAEGVERDYARAASNYARAVELGEVAAFARLGDAYECGRGVPSHLEKAFALFDRGSQLGSKECAFRAALCCSRDDFLSPAPEKAVEFLNLCADTYPRAALLLGRACRDGWGCRPDGPRALQLFEKAMHALPEAMAEKGALLQRGMPGVAVDVETANMCYREAAAAGDSRGARYLARNYETGTGFARPEPRAAFEFFERGATLGCTKSMTRLGLMRLKGKGCSKSDELAAQLFIKAAQGGDPRAMRRLAVCYSKGIGVEKDAEEATRWSVRAMGIGGSDEG